MTRARPPIDHDEDLKTEIYDGGTKADAPQTVVAKGRKPTMPPPIPKAPKLPAVVKAVTKPEPSEPMRAISMKTPADVGQPAKQPKHVRPEIPQVKLRSIADSAQSTTPPRGMGNLALPRDFREARKQRIWSNTFWASIAVIIAALVALVIWLILGRK